jgi:death-on-curing family protein
MNGLPVSISPEEIIEIHDAALLRYRGLPGVRQEGCVQQVHGSAMLAEQYSGNEDGTLGLCFIGSLMFYLIKGQCFMDGNKRTGLAVALKLLASLGLTIDAMQDEAKRYCERIADDRALRSEDVVRWLAARAIQQ